MFFLAIFNRCPILTCPGMTNYHNISDLDKTCCVNCTELHSSLLTIISTFSFWNRSYVAIKSFAWSNQLFAMVSKTGADRQKEYYDNNGQAVKLSKLRWRSGWRAWRLHGCLWSQWWWINPILNTFVTNWKIVTPKDILNIVIPGHLAKMDGMIFPGWYFDFGRQAGTYVVFGECLDPQNVRLTAPTFKKVLLSFRDKFHVFRWPSNIGLDMSDIFLNSDTE